MFVDCFDSIPFAGSLLASEVYTVTYEQLFRTLTTVNIFVYKRIDPYTNKSSGVEKIHVVDLLACLESKTEK